MIKFCVPIHKLQTLNTSNILRMGLFHSELVSSSFSSEPQICTRPELYLIFAKLLGVNFEFSMTDINLGGEVYENGTATGMMQLFQKKAIDVVFRGFAWRSNRKKLAKFVYPISFDSGIDYLCRQSYSSLNLQMDHTFIYLFGLAISAFLFSFLVNYFFPIANYGFIKLANKTFNIFLGMGFVNSGLFYFNAFSIEFCGKLLVLTGVIGTNLFKCNSYVLKNTLQSSLIANPSLEPSIEHFKEMKLKMIVINHYYLNKSEWNGKVEMATYIQMTSQPHQIVKKILEGSHLFAHYGNSLESIKNAFLDFKLRQVSLLPSTTMSSFIMAKSLPQVIERKINVITRRLYESGIYWQIHGAEMKFREKNQKKANLLFRKEYEDFIENEGKETQLRFRELVGLFHISLILYLLCFVVSLSEMLKRNPER